MKIDKFIKELREWGCLHTKCRNGVDNIYTQRKLTGKEQRTFVVLCRYHELYCFQKEEFTEVNDKELELILLLD